MKLFHEFKGPILFVVKFLILYLVFNLIYGIYVDYYSPRPDPITSLVTKNTEFLLNLIGYNTSSSPAELGSNVLLKEGNKTILLVYEGCNGVNVVIIFAAFILSFSRLNINMFWFIPLGLLIIHLTNLARIGLLFYVTKHLPDYLYFTHKYLFTAIIYLIVFACWYVWVSKINKHASR